MNDIETAAAAAIRPISLALEADGYDLSIQQASAQVVDVRISASPDACEDCLAPKSVLLPMLESLLGENDLGLLSVRLTYPNES